MPPRSCPLTDKGLITLPASSSSHQLHYPRLPVSQILPSTRPPAPYKTRSEAAGLSLSAAFGSRRCGLPPAQRKEAWPESAYRRQTYLDDNATSANGRPLFSGFRFTKLGGPSTPASSVLISIGCSICTAISKICRFAWSRRPHSICRVMRDPARKCHEYRTASHRYPPTLR